MEIKQISDLNPSFVGKRVSFKGKITTIKQTGGPTLMIINDGTSNFTLKAFLKPGVRAYPEVNENDFVNVFGEITKRNEGIECEVSDMKKLSNEEIATMAEEIKKLQEKQFEPTVNEFTIKSEVLESLKNRFIKIAKIIRKAIVEGRPILMRHNADCDGYSSAITMERAILGFMKEVFDDDQLLYQNYRRAPSKAPFYEYEDSVKDLSYWLRDKVKNGAKEPLIIVTDNGSTEEDILAMKQMLLYNAEIVVIDHHFPGNVVGKGDEAKVEVDNYIKAHINPYLTGYDSNVCTGMLGYEMARFIYEKANNSILIPAMSAILDHTEGTEREQYVKKAIEAGFSEEYLQTLGEIVDMQSHYLRFQEAREFVDDLFGNNMEAQKKIVEMLGPELNRLYESRWQVAKHYTEKIDFGKFYLVLFDGEKGTNRGEYPAIGKSTNHIHRKFEEELDKPIITATHGTTFMTIRCSDPIEKFSVPEFCSKYAHKMKHTGAEGGGHEKAGSVKFVEYGREEIISAFKKYLEEL